MVDNLAYVNDEILPRLFSFGWAHDNAVKKWGPTAGTPEYYEMVDSPWCPRFSLERPTALPTAPSKAVGSENLGHHGRISQPVLRSATSRLRSVVPLDDSPMDGRQPFSLESGDGRQPFSLYYTFDSLESGRIRIINTCYEE